MGTMTDILKRIDKRISIMVLIDEKPLVEVSVEKKEIIVEVKNPLLAIEYGLKKFFESRKVKEKSDTSRVLKMIKDKGYKIKVKYGVFEFDV
ncbi:MAG: hypothetical protein ACXABY_14675 [Candidatus Thorarchaeota archaeon]|jgi:hypothetical protein